MGEENDNIHSLPAYRVIAANIQRSIVEQKLTGNSKLPSELELAAQYGVSRGTVTKALDMLVQQGILYRRRPQGTFVSPSSGVHLVTQGQRQEASVSAAPAQVSPPMVGLIVPYLADEFLGSIVQGISTVLRTADFALSFASSECDWALERYHIDQFLRQGVAGIIIFPGDHQVQERAGRLVSVNEVERVEVLQALQQKNMPFVLIDRYIPEVESDYVISDDVTAGYAATQHLFALGHRRIGFITINRQMTSGAQRYAGYQQSLRENCQPLEEQLVLQALYQSSPLSMPGGVPVSQSGQMDRSLVVQYLRQPERPSAIVAMHDYVALRVLQAAEDLGLDVPGDVALVSCGAGDIGAHVRVPLTSVIQPAAEIGRQSAQILLDRIAQRASKIRQITLPVSLVVRKSCGANQQQIPVILPAYNER